MDKDKKPSNETQPTKAEASDYGSKKTEGSSKKEGSSLDWLHEAAKYEPPPQKKEPPKNSKDWMGDAGRVV